MGQVLVVEERVKLSNMINYAKKGGVCSGTEIITRYGLMEIDEISPTEEIAIWSLSKGWIKTNVVPQGQSNYFYRVKFADGSKIDVGEGHSFSIADRFSCYKGYRKVRVEDLHNFSKYRIHTESFQIKYEDGKTEPEAYTLGFTVGDGHIDRKKAFIVLYGEKDFKCPVSGDRKGVERKPRYNVDSQKVDVTSFVNKEQVLGLKNTESQFLDLFYWDRRSILDFMGGVADADGSNASNGIRIYLSDKERAIKAQLLLTKCGVRSSVNLCQEKGVATNLGIRKRDLYYLQITNCKDIGSKRLNVSNDKFGKCKGKYQHIRSIERINNQRDFFHFNIEQDEKIVIGNILSY